MDPELLAQLLRSIQARPDATRAQGPPPAPNDLDRPRTSIRARYGPRFFPEELSLAMERLTGRAGRAAPEVTKLARFLGLNSPEGVLASLTPGVPAGGASGRSLGPFLRRDRKLFSPGAAENLALHEAGKPITFDKLLDFSGADDLRVLPHDVPTKRLYELQDALDVRQRRVLEQFPANSRDDLAGMWRELAERQIGNDRGVVDAELRRRGLGGRGRGGPRELTDEERRAIDKLRGKEGGGRGGDPNRPPGQPEVHTLGSGGEDPFLRSTYVTADDALSLSLQDVEAAARRAIDADRDMLKTLFGEAGAREYSRLQRIANSTTRSSDETSAAYRQVSDMESRLTKQQQDALFGIGLPKNSIADPSELTRLEQAANFYKQSNVGDVPQEQLLNTVAREVTQGKPDDVISLVKLKGATEELRRRGLTDEQIIREGVRVRSAAGFASEADLTYLFQQRISGLNRRPPPIDPQQLPKP